MANTFLNTGRTTGLATSNPETNISQVSGQSLQNNTNSTVVQPTQGQISPITIPIQIQPQIAQAGQVQTTSVQPNSNLQVNNTQQQVQPNNAPTPQIYKGTNQNNNVVDFNQIYSAYNQAVGKTNTNANTNTSGIKKTSLGTTIVTPTTANLNTVQGQYQSAYADTVNGLISEMLSQMNNGFSYDPTQDSALKMASEYAANTTLQSLAGSGVLNSSSTSERVARIVSELIPTYEEKAHSRWIEYLGQLSDTAQIVMNYDSQQFEYWKDAKDREFEEKTLEYQKQQDALENAWKRVDELGYVDNEASAILGVVVGTLSGKARETKEQREYELQKMREQAEIEYENQKALYELKTELETEQSKTLAEHEYTLQQKYGSSSSNNVSLSTYDSIIQNRYADYDDITKKYTVSGNNNSNAYNYLVNEVQTGRISENDFYSLMSKYNIQSPVETYYNDIKAQYDKTAKSVTSNSGKQRLNQITADAINSLYQQGKINNSDVATLLSRFGLS